MTSRWIDGPIQALDLETTGLDTETARIVTAAIVRYEPRDVIGAGKTTVRSWLVDPGIEIPADATAIHGITTEQARAEGMPASVAVAEIFQLLDDAWSNKEPLVVFNAPYDLTILDRELRRHHADKALVEVGPVIDPLVLDRALDPYRRGSGTRKLSYICDHIYGVDLGESAHGARADALAAMRVAWKIGIRHADVIEDLVGMQRLQADWHAAWAASFEAYLRTRGNGDVIDRSWPLVPWRQSG